MRTPYEYTRTHGHEIKELISAQFATKVANLIEKGEYTLNLEE